MKQQMPILVK